jgi:phosphatidylinositol alpha-1,6-mannosyltransferase
MVYGIDGWSPVSGLRRRGLRGAGRLLYISEYTRQRSQEANPWLSAVPSEVCHLGLLPDAPCHTPDESALPGDIRSLARVPFALMIGRILSQERYKGHEELIRVWPEVQRRRPGLRLVLVGEGSDRARLENLARQLRADAHFLGAVDEPVRDWLLHHCRCFCMPSRGEGFGLVYLEAMRAGKPVLAGDADAAREVVVDGVTGRTVDAACPTDLLDGILDVCGAQADHFGRAGRQRYLECFTYERFVRRFGAHVRGLLGMCEANHHAHHPCHSRADL